jgi:hypothetical protein
VKPPSTTTLIFILLATLTGSAAVLAQSPKAFLDIDMITSYGPGAQTLAAGDPQLTRHTAFILAEDEVGGWFVRALTLSGVDGSRMGNRVDIVNTTTCVASNACKIMYSRAFLPDNLLVINEAGAAASMYVQIASDGTPLVNGPGCWSSYLYGLTEAGPATAMTEIGVGGFESIDFGWGHLYVGTPGGTITSTWGYPWDIVFNAAYIHLLDGHPIDDLEPIPQGERTLLGVSSGANLYGLVDSGMVGSGGQRSIQFTASNPTGLPIGDFDAMVDPNSPDGPVYIVFSDSEHGRVVRATLPPDASGSLELEIVSPNPILPRLAGPPQALVLGSLLLLSQDGQNVYFDPGYDVVNGFSGCLADVNDPGPAICAECPFSFTGDVNQNNSINSADVVYLMNYIFKGGPDPLPCPANGDVNCSYSIDSADLIHMVNWVFRGGPPVCDECDVSWTCD